MTEGDSHRTPLRIAVWCAVSTPAQVEDKDSLPSQLAAGREFAEALSGQVVRVYEVPGHSRRYLDYPDAAREMDAYRELDEDCHARTFDVLWCRSRDRLGRTLSLIAAVEGRVRDVAGAEVYSAAMPHRVGSGTTDSQVLMTAIEGWSAEREVAELKRRQRFGMRGRVRRGLPANNWPVGYRPVRDEHGEIVGGELDANAPAIRLATSLYLRGLSNRAIADALNARYPSPTADVWYPGTVWKIVHNDHYAGLPSWGEAQAEAVSRRYPPLWDEVTFAAVRAERRRRADHYAPRARASLYRVAYCGHCGARMIRHRGGGGHRYLVCSAHKKAVEVCCWNGIREEEAIGELVELLGTLEDRSAFEELVGAQSSEQADVLTGELATLEGRIEETEARRRRLALALAAGSMDASMYRETDDTLLSELDRLNQARREAQGKLEATPDRDAQSRELAHLAPRWPDLFETLSGRELSAMLQRLGVVVWVEEGEVAGFEIR